MANKEKYDLFLKHLGEVAGPEHVRKMQEAFLGRYEKRRTADKSGLMPNAQEDYLSPENINRVARTLFMPQVMQSANAPYQTGVNALRGLSARAGLLESPFALQAEAGLRGQQTGGAIAEAFNRAIQHGQARASAQTGSANLMAQFPPVYGSEMLDPLKQAFSTYAAYRGFQGQPQGSPYSFPWQGQQQGFQIPNAGSYLPTPR